MKYIKSVLWRVAKRLSHIEDAWCLKVKFTVTVYFVIPQAMSLTQLNHKTKINRTSTTDLKRHSARPANQVNGKQFHVVQF